MMQRLHIVQAVKEYSLFVIASPLGYFAPPREEFAQGQSHHSPAVPRLFEFFADLRRDLIQCADVLILKQQSNLHEAMMLMSLVPVFMMPAWALVSILHSTTSSGRMRR
jgi:hypothetical protein